MEATHTPILEIDLTYGGIYAGTSFEFSPQVAQHFNDAADGADDVLDGEFVPFEPGDYFSIACPLASAYPREAFVAAYAQLSVVVDGSRRLRLAAYPRLVSNDPADVSLIRAVPTYIPKLEMPDGFFGHAHTIELFQGERSIFGPVQRFFHTNQSGLLFNQLEDGHGCLVADVGGELDTRVRSDLFVFFTDPTFGEPTGAAQVADDGETTVLPYRLLGKDHVGCVMLFNEGVVSGVAPREGRAVVELYLPERGVGLAAVLYSGHTRDTAFRVDARVL